MLKRILPSTIFILTTFFSFANELYVKSEIKHVTVFLNGAQIERKGTAKLSKGMNEIILEGVSDKINAKSFQVSATGARVLSTKYTNINITKQKDHSKRIRTIEDSIAKIDYQIREINYKKKTYQAEAEVMNLYHKVGSGETGFTVDDLSKLSELHRTRLWNINKNLFELEEKFKRLQEEKRNHQYNITALKRVLPPEYVHAIKIKVQANAAVTSTFNVKYLVGGAAWAPNYDIRVVNTNKDIKIDYHADVMNQSGEDWINKPMTISTFVSEQTLALPKLNEWKVGKRYTSNNPGRSHVGPKDISRSVAQQSSDLKLLDGVEYAEIEVSGIGVDFKLKEKYNIPSDGQVYLVDITEYTLPAMFKYYSIPKMDKDAFILSQISGWEKLNLIEGKANIFLRESFVGESYIKPGVVGDTLSIALGRDNKVYVSRERVEEKTTKQIIGSHKKEIYTYKLTVKNTNPNPIKMVLIDQVPISTDDEVTVNILELSGGIKDDYNGQVDWEVALDAGESKEYILSFSLKYPKTMKMDNSRKANYYQRKVKAKF